MTQGLRSFFVRFSRDESGQDLVEWALMAGFVAVAAAACFPETANRFINLMSDLAAGVRKNQDLFLAAGAAILFLWCTAVATLRSARRRRKDSR